MTEVVELDTGKKDGEPAATTEQHDPGDDDERIVAGMAEHMAAIMTELNLDLDDPELQSGPPSVSPRCIWRCSTVCARVPNRR